MNGFVLKAPSDLGFTVRCFTDTRIYVFNNVSLFESYDNYKECHLSSDHHEYQNPLDLSQHTSIEIEAATEIAPFLLDIIKK